MIRARRLSLPRRVDRDLHDRCLRACREHRAELTDGQLIVLNKVAVGFPLNEPVDLRDIEVALAIMDHLDAKGSAS